jgi:glycine/D-amino acid oxidase-like deaminating enzyme
VDLRSGTPLWIARGKQGLEFQPLSVDIRADVAILGGGITGALIAYQLVKQGASVVLIDRREIGRGSTAASTGLLQYEVDTPLVELVKQVGQEHAVRAYRRGLWAIDQIETIVDELGDDCGFARRETLYFASAWWHRWRLKHEFDCRRHFGFDVDFLSRRQLLAISSIHAAAAIRSRGDAQIDPFRFTQSLVAKAVHGGLQAFAHTNAVKIDELHDCVLVHTQQGVLQAGKIVYATGYESNENLSDPQGNLNSTYALASQAGLKVPGWPDKCLIWETSRPYFYARRTDDGRAIVGGGDTEFSTDHQREGLVERKVAKLVQRFEQLFPSADLKPEFSWAGTFAETKDGLAYIGQPAGRPRAYFALGYGGNGITFSTIAARLIGDLIAGRPNEDASVFRLGRR